MKWAIVGKLLFLLICIQGVVSLSWAQQDGREVTIGLIPEMNVFKQMDRFRPLGEYLSKETGLKIQFTILSRYGNLIERFSEEEMDGAFFGSFTGALAITKLNVVPLARPVNLNGQSTYHGVIYVRKDSGIKGVENMRGKRFAFVEKATTAGYVYPLAYFREQGVEDIDGYLEEYFFAGSHDASLYAVLNGKADVGASKDSIFDWIRSIDPRIDEEIEVLAVSGDVPSNALCVRWDLDESIKERLKASLLNLHATPEGRKVLQAFHALRFLETGVEDYQPVFLWAEKAGIDLPAYDYRNE